MIYNVMSFLGIFLLVVLGCLFSTNRKRINWTLVAWGIGLQLLFAVFVFRVPAGIRLFMLLNDVVVRVVEASAEGARFLFGPLALPPGVSGSVGFILAFQALPTIIFFSAFMSVLYFVNIMPLLIRGFAGIFSRTMKLSGAESVSVASNIFVGIESIFTIRPHLADMTRSELCTILTTGMATVASNVLALYVFTLQKQFPTIAGHLVSASILAAPAAVIMSKVLLPEELVPKTLGKAIHVSYERDSNLFEAIINGANAGVKVVVGVAALLVAVLGLVALCDILLTALGGRMNTLLAINVDWSLKGLLGILFYPFSLIMGVSPDDALVVAKIVGERTVATEVVGYQDLAKAIDLGLLKHPRSIVITTYALCGFAHLASMAIFVGGMSALAPSKMKTLSQIGFRSLCAATLACLMTACVAGIFFTDHSILLGK
jgi:concentrative nucleoside transporter, CNT family